MIRATLPLLVSGLAIATPLRFQQSSFVPGADGRPAGWTVWSARPENAVRAFVDPVRYRGEPGSLAISGNSNLAGHGGWERTVAGVEAGAWYRFAAYYRSEGVPCELWQVVARLDWRSAQNRRVSEPEYVYKFEKDGEWTRISLDVQAPAGAAAVKVQLFLSNAPLGAVWWDDISLEAIGQPAPRQVTVAAINLRPSQTGSPAESVRQFVEAVGRAVPGKTDLILLPEGITVIGTGKTYAEVAEPVPGPTTVRLGELARQRSSYVVAGIYEREGTAVYNTAVLLDRSGRLVGKYRKVYVPPEEFEGGITPGNDYPVFRTDFGTIGLMICYDVFYADAARALAVQGAELVLLPIWGGNETLAKARAIENCFYLIASGYDHPTYVMDPDGEIVALARQRGEAAIATLDLNKRYLHKYLGDRRARLMKELRLDVKIPVPGSR